MKLTVDIMEDFINSLDLNGVVSAFSDDGIHTTIQVGKTYHARTGMLLNIDGSQYPIVSVIDNASITVEGVIVNPQVYSVPNPFYFHGTPIMTNANHISGAKGSDKLPMVYLYEILREVDQPEDSRIVREADLRLFFLDEANLNEWTTDDHYSRRIKGLNNLVDQFIESAIQYTCCFYLYETPFTRVNHANWGVYLDNKGHERKIFDDDLSGVELRFTLPIRNCN
jgi:hypothetical protein